MLSRNLRPSRFPGYVRFILSTGLALFTIFVTPLAAQTEVAPDPSAPADDTPLRPNPSAPAAPATPAQTSAATVVSDSSQTANNNALSAGGAGVTPNAGPGAPPESNLGIDISSASLSHALPFRVTATIGEAYNNNIFNRPKKDGDFITRVAVEGEYRVGDLAAVDGNYFDLLYSPSLHVYARHDHETGVDQYADALYGHRWTKLTLTLEQSYRKTQENDASIGGLVNSDVYTTIAKARYLYSPDLDIVLTGQQDFTSYDEPDYTDSKEWSGTIYALYHIDPKLSVGFGPRIGYLNLEMEPNETYQQFLARVIYDPTDKFHFEGTAGAEDREYQTVGRSNTLEPIFEFVGDYRPNPSTVITLNSSRLFRPTYNTAGQDYIGTNVSTTVTQRFFEAYYLGLAAGFENDEYQNVAFVAGSTREDNYFYLEPSLVWSANGWLKVSAFDRYEEDNSNFDIFTYDTNQVGVSISATY